MSSEYETIRKLIMQSGLFDGEWYCSTYSDAVGSHLSPLDHFIKFGLLLDRDPGPAFSSAFHRHGYDPDKVERDHPFLYHLRHPDAGIEKELVLQAAMQVFLRGQHKLALSLARTYLPQHLAITVSAIEANCAWLANDSAGWQAAINKYLVSNNLAEITLRPAETVLGQLCCPSTTPVHGGPLISVIMPVWNAQQTLEIAVNSILHQTWREIEIIAVDDASTDRSWTILEGIAARDKRLKPIRNSVNVGPYVSKNIGLLATRGVYVTGHDADDWAHPERLARHMEMITARPEPLPVSMPYGLRMQPDGLFHHTRRAGEATSLDGWMQSTPIGTLFEAEFLKNRLGFWDSVRFGADTEILLRARQILGKGPLEIPLMSMICLDAPHSLSNNSVHGTRAQHGGLSATRRAYLRSIRDWLIDNPAEHSAFLSFPQDRPRYAIPKEMRVSSADIRANLKKL